jgi:hypothetical protein
MVSVVPYLGSIIFGAVFIFWGRNMFFFWLGFLAFGGFWWLLASVAFA